jgi:hypothetical protein
MPDPRLAALIIVTPPHLSAAAICSRAIHEAREEGHI